MTKEFFNHLVSLGLPEDIAQLMAEETNLTLPEEQKFEDAYAALWGFAAWELTTQGHDFWSDYTQDWHRKLHGHLKTV